MKTSAKPWPAALAVVLLTACGADQASPIDSRKPEPHDTEPERGPNGGRILRDGDLAVELAIVEAGTPPEFRLWATESGRPVSLDAFDAEVTLDRLGGARDVVTFQPAGEFLRGDGVVREPHSFAVTVDATYAGQSHRWRYDSFEGRTRIAAHIAAAAGIATEVAGPATIRESATVYGRIVPNVENIGHVSARFDGVIRSVSASIGQRVERGQSLAIVEADDSLAEYTVRAPIAGTVVEREANSGETTSGRTLFTIVDTSSVWAELAVFPGDRPRVGVGTPVSIRTAVGDIEVGGEIAFLSPIAGRNQSIVAQVPLDNSDGLLAAGMHVTGEIQVGVHDVPLAVRRSGLQTFREFTVVYAQVGEEYEVRMLDLGRQDGIWAEVLGGLDVGTRYVTTNSYTIKADIEKAGASHDH